MPNQKWLEAFHSWEWKENFYRKSRSRLRKLLIGQLLFVIVEVSI